MNAFPNSLLALTATFGLFTGFAWSAERQDNPLVGQWLVDRVIKQDGTMFPFDIVWEFTKEQVIVKDLTNSQEISRNSYTIDTTKDPKWITVTVIDLATEIRPGIFRIVGDELHLKQTIGGNSRPKHFEKGTYRIMKRLNQKKGQQDGGGNAHEPHSHPSTTPTKARATP